MTWKSNKILLSLSMSEKVVKFCKNDRSQEKPRNLELDCHYITSRRSLSVTMVVMLFSDPIVVGVLAIWIRK